MNKKNTFLIIAFSVIVTLGVSISIQSLYAAWTSPTALPPGNNVAKPINVGSDPQCKSGELRAYGGFVLDTMSPAQEWAASTTFENGQMWLRVPATPAPATCP